MTSIEIKRQVLMANKSTIVARSRWKLLGEALKTGQVNSSTNVSIRNFKGFDLFCQKVCHPVDYSSDDGEWLEYSSSSFPTFTAIIRHCPNKHTLDVLKGFNNTGNVGVWPSEEVLAHYCLQHMDSFNGKSVCELGGGMTCLAGISIWSCTNDAEIVLSDGNDRSIQNLEMIVNRNSNKVGRDRISVRKIRWGPSYETENDDLREKFDYILCADCLFFKETVESLADLIHMALKPKGIAVIVAPSRKGSFQYFGEIAKSKFEVQMINNYDESIEKLHQENLKNNPCYCEDLHYPRMIQLTKSF